MPETPSLVELVPAALSSLVVFTLVGCISLVFTIRNAFRGFMSLKHYPISILPAVSGIAFSLHAFTERLLMMGQQALPTVETTAAFFVVPAYGSFVTIALVIAGLMCHFLADVRSKRHVEQ